MLTQGINPKMGRPFDTMGKNDAGNNVGDEEASGGGEGSESEAESRSGDAEEVETPSDGNDPVINASKATANNPNASASNTGANVAGTQTGFKFGTEYGFSSSNFGKDN